LPGEKRYNNIVLNKQIFDLIAKIPKGRVTTYKAIGDKLGTKGYQAIGQILKHNQNAPVVPCHRVICNNGRLGGYLGNETDKKIKLLESEGVTVINYKVVNFNQILIKFE